MHYIKKFIFSKKVKAIKLILLMILSVNVFSYEGVENIFDDSPQEEKLIHSYIKKHQSKLAIKENPYKSKLLKNILKVKREKRLFIKNNFNHIKPEKHKLVDFFVQYYTTLGRAFLSRALKRYERFFPVFKRYAEKLDIPLEISLLGIVESGYRPKAYSSKGARGIWQLMPVTAKIYGIKIHSQLDERMDIDKSTYAALRYIQSLRRTFNDKWQLIIAAYNGGGTYLNRQLRKHKVSDFWKLCQKGSFKSETLEFVPRFYAVLHILKNTEKYGFITPDLQKKQYLDKISIAKRVALSSVSKYTSIPQHILRDLNPHFIEQIAVKGATLYVPDNMGKMVAKRIKTFYRRKILAKRRRRWARRRRWRRKRRIIRYRVKRGDSLSRIARRYKSSVRRIMRINRLRSARRIRRGQILRIPRYYKVSRRRYRSRKKDRRKYRRRRYQKLIYYRVRSGDSLTRIAKKYGTTVRKIKRKNRLRTNMIRKGQRLKIPVNRWRKKAVRYKIKRGDTLSALAMRFKSSIKKIIRYNKIRSKSNIKAGRVIWIPLHS